MASFQDIKSPSERKLQFTLVPTTYSYANTLRRAIMTLVKTVGFRSDPPGIVLADSDIKILRFLLLFLYCLICEYPYLFISFF